MQSIRKQFANTDKNTTLPTIFIFTNDTMQYILAWAISLIIIFAGLYISKRLWILDRPGPDIKPARKGVPTMQGAVAYIAILTALTILIPQWRTNSIVLWFVVWITILIIVATRDECAYLYKIKDVPMILRLLTQMIAAGVAIYISGGIMDERIFRGEILQIPTGLFMAGFIIRTMLCINAINRFDGVYGLASWVSSIWFLTIVLLIQLVVLPYYTDIGDQTMQTLQVINDIAIVLAIISAVYAGIEYKPHGLVRDLGTMVFGFWLAYLSVVWGAKIGTLIVALSLVIFDAIRVWLHRIFFLKKNPLSGDYTHLHYRLLRLGRSRGEIRSFVRIRSTIMMILMLLQWANRIDKVIIFALMAAVFFGVNAYIFRIKKLPCGLEIKKK